MSAADVYLIGKPGQHKLLLLLLLLSPAHTSGLDVAAQGQLSIFVALEMHRRRLVHHHHHHHHHGNVDGAFTHTLRLDGMGSAGNSMYFNGGVHTLSYQRIPSHPSAACVCECTICSAPIQTASKNIGATRTMTTWPVNIMRAILTINKLTFRYRVSSKIRDGVTSNVTRFNPTYK